MIAGHVSYGPNRRQGEDVPPVGHQLGVEFCWLQSGLKGPKGRGAKSPVKGLIGLTNEATAVKHCLHSHQHRHATSGL